MTLSNSRSGAGDLNLKEIRELASIASQLFAVCTMMQLSPPNQSEFKSVSLPSLLPVISFIWAL